MEQFKNDDPATALQMVLTTYQTFHIRSIFFEDAKGKGRETEDCEEDDEDDAPEDNEDANLSKEQLRSLSTKTAGLFGTVLCDGPTN